MFVALMGGKIWGWIADGRVESAEQQPPVDPRLFHTRLSISLIMSLIYDMWILIYAVNTVIQQARPNMMIMFLFEFAILTASSSSTFFRYIISLVDQWIVQRQTKEMLESRRRDIREQREAILRERAAAAASGEGLETTDVEEPLPSEDDIEEMDIEVPGWETKGQWVLTLHLVTGKIACHVSLTFADHCLADFLKLGIYLAFFFVLLRFFGLPIHIMRDLYLTARSFVKRLNAFIKYRNATRDMNQRYPDATVEEIQREDTCIICREEMRPWSITNPEAGAPAAGAAQTPATRTPIISERSRPKKLPCGHVLHLGCLKSWLERQQVCPTCRRPVDARTPAGPAQRPGQGAQPQIPEQAPLPNAGAPGQPPVMRGGMINIGPLRLAFGRGVLPPVPNQPGFDGQPAIHQPGIPPNARVYGFEMGFPPAPQIHGPAQGAPQPGLDVHAQLQQIEQRINQEIQSLSVAHRELRLVQNLQAELLRLRQLQGTGNISNHAQPASSASTNIHTPQMPFPQVPFPTRTTTVQRHGTLPGSTAIPSGSPDLPPGVTIPEGWSLLPLQNLDDLTPQTIRTAEQSQQGPATPHVHSHVHAHAPSPLSRSSTEAVVPTGTGDSVGNPPGQAENQTVPNVQPGNSGSPPTATAVHQTSLFVPASSPTGLSAPPPAESSGEGSITTEPADSITIDEPEVEDDLSLPTWGSHPLFRGPGEVSDASGTNGTSAAAADVLPHITPEDQTRPVTDQETAVELGEEEKSRWKGKGKAASVEEDAEADGDA
jgi:E3 ubiquitin-protein ligase synoviolin